MEQDMNAALHKRFHSKADIASIYNLLLII